MDVEEGVEAYDAVDCVTYGESGPEAEERVDCVIGGVLWGFLGGLRLGRSTISSLKFIADNAH